MIATTLLRSLGTGVARLACLGLVLAITPIAQSEDIKDLENSLRNTYVHKLLSLKSPSFGHSLEFDSSGNLVNKTVEGPWSTCGLVYVEKLSVTTQRLEIEGRRVILALRSTGSDGKAQSTRAGPQITPLITDDKVRISIRLQSLDPSTSKDLMFAVFQAGESLEQRVAASWKPTTADFMNSLRTTPNAAVGEVEGHRPVYLAAPGVVTPPKPLHTPDPEYPDSARRKRAEGNTVLLVVVNERGFPEVLQICKGLGEGLDIHALAAVAGWRFKPAMKDGNPVAVLINVEVNFRLR